MKVYFVLEIYEHETDLIRYDIGYSFNKKLIKRKVRKLNQDKTKLSFIYYEVTGVNPCVK